VIRRPRRGDEEGMARAWREAGVDSYVGSPLSMPFYERRMRYARRSMSFRKRL
jgi:hypothetical protein